MKDRTKFCRICGECFQANTANHRYCSRRCESRAYRIRKGIILDRGRYCRQCGEQFFPTYVTGANQQHCSKMCSVKSARESRSKFYIRNPQKLLEYRERARQKVGPDGNLKRFRARYPNITIACQSCGESRVVDIAHRPEYKRNGAWRSAKNSTPEKIWLLCPTCHALLDRMHYSPLELGLS